jgi:hypothetical protein
MNPIRSWILLAVALLLSLAVAGCTYQKTSTTSETTNCSLGGCDSTTKSTPAADGAMTFLVLAGSVAVAMRREGSAG